MLISMKMALLKRQMTQVELARQLEVSETRVSRIIQGRLVAEPEEMREIARILGAPGRELFPEDRAWGKS